MNILKNKKVLALLITIIVVILYFICSSDIERTLICSSSDYLVGNRAYQEHIFTGYNKYIEKEVVETTVFIDDKEALNNYYEIIKSNEECSNILLEEDSIRYTCNYDLKKNHYYSELEDNNQRLTFDSIKKNFEEDNFVCSFK